MDCLDALHDAIAWCAQAPNSHILNFHLEVTIAAPLDPARDVTTEYQGKLAYSPASPTAPTRSFHGSGTAVGQSGQSASALLTLDPEVVLSITLDSSDGQESFNLPSPTCTLDAATGVVILDAEQLTHPPNGMVPRTDRFVLTLEQGLTADEPLRGAREQAQNPPPIGEGGA